MKRIACVILILGLGLSGCKSKEEKIADTRIIKETVSNTSKEKIKKNIESTQSESLVSNDKIDNTKESVLDNYNDIEETESTVEETENRLEKVDILQIIYNAYNKTLNDTNWLVSITLYQDLIDKDSLDTHGIYEEYAIFNKDMVELYRIDSTNYVDQKVTFLNRTENNEFNYYSAKNGDTSFFSVVRDTYNFSDLEKCGFNIVLETDSYNLSKIINSDTIDILDFEKYNYQDANYEVIWARENNIDLTLTIKNEYISEIIVVDKDKLKFIDTSIYGPDRDKNFYNTFKNSLYNQSLMSNIVVDQVISTLDKELTDDDKSKIDWNDIVRNKN